MHAHTTTYQAQILPIKDSVHSALIIYGAATATDYHKNLKFGRTWQKEDYQVYESHTVPGQYNLVFKIGGHINMHSLLAAHGFKFVDDSCTFVRKYA